MRNLACAASAAGLLALVALAAAPAAGAEPWLLYCASPGDGTDLVLDYQCQVHYNEGGVHLMCIVTYDGATGVEHNCVGP